MEIQKRIKERNSKVAEKEQIALRYATHFGETLMGEDGEPYGDAVNMAFRLESLRGEQMIETQGGISKSEFPQKDYVLTTEVVYNDIRNRPGVDCRLLGLFELPGFVGLHRIYEIIV